MSGSKSGFQANLKKMSHQFLFGDVCAILLLCVQIMHADGYFHDWKVRLETCSVTFLEVASLLSPAKNFWP